MQPIQTRYRGYHFRSRLEARWAVAFDEMKLRWEYEPEGFVLADGTHYLPDFKVGFRGYDLWVEVKPDGKKSEPFAKFMNELQGHSLGVILGSIPDPLSIRNGGINETEQQYEALFAEGGADFYYKFCACPQCDEVGFEFDGRSARIGCGCTIHENSDKNYFNHHPKVISAFAKARSARFEHEARERF